MWSINFLFLDDRLNIFWSCIFTVGLYAFNLYNNVDLNPLLAHPHTALCVVYSRKDAAATPAAEACHVIIYYVDYCSTDCMYATTVSTIQYNRKTS